MNSQVGNVMFLILIAVILFAALSFALTQSSVGTPAGAKDEGADIDAAQLSQYPTFIRSQILRMRMNKIELFDIEFNPPSDFSNLTSPEVGIFMPPDGATYTMAPTNVMENNQQGRWYYNMHFEIKNIGASAASSTKGNDLIAFLPGIKQHICLQINKLFDLATIPTVNNAAYHAGALELMNHAYAPPASETVIGDTELTPLAGQPFGCFQETASSGEYIYYFTLYER